MDHRDTRPAGQEGDPVIAPVVPVSGHLRVVVGLHDSQADPCGSTAAMSEVPPVTVSDLLGPFALLRGPILLLLAAIPIGVVFGGVGWIAVLLAILAGALRILQRRTGFSFGDGFVGPRLELGWPRGVQEDDDVHWTWAMRAADARKR
jgi:hypothetical protein